MNIFSFTYEPQYMLNEGWMLSNIQEISVVNLISQLKSYISN